MTDVRTLGAADAADFQRLFVRALNEHPEAFGVSVSEQEALPLATLAEWFAAPVNRFYGAFHAQSVMVGIANLQRYTRQKMAHRASIGGMYVAPEARGQGIGKALMEQAMRDARAWDVEDVVLAVTVGNTAAQRLYTGTGFTTYSTDPRLLKVNDCYYDIEWMIYRMNSE